MEMDKVYVRFYSGLTERPYRLGIPKGEIPKGEIPKAEQPRRGSTEFAQWAMTREELKALRRKIKEALAVEGEQP